MSEIGAPYLCAGCVPKVVGPIDLESQMVVGMNHLVSHGILQVSLVFHFIGTNQNAVFWVEASAFSVCTSAAVDVVAMEIAS